MNERPGAPPDTPARHASALAEIVPRLERARRETLTRELGAGPMTARIAHWEAHAAILRGAARVVAIEVEASRGGLTDEHAASLAHYAGSLLTEAADVEARVRSMIARALCGDAAPRYLELEARVLSLHRATRLRDLVNEVLQARTRLGSAAVARLWRTLLDVAAREDATIDSDLRDRYRRETDEAAGDALAQDGDAMEAGRRVRALAREVEALDALADDMPSDELFYQIESIGGRLKQIQTHESSALDAAADEALRRAFRALTVISKRCQPGWTPVLNAEIRDRDWAEIANNAARWLATREAERTREREDARRRERDQAVTRLREAHRREDLDAAIERLRAAAWSIHSALDGNDPSEAATIDVQRETARAQAALAIKLARGDDDIERVVRALGSMTALVEEGRAFRPLRRWLHPEGPFDAIEPDKERVPPPESAETLLDEAEADPDEAYEQEWPADILDVERAGEGERVLLVGGLPDDRRRERLTRFFGWIQADWAESYRDRQADFKGLRRRIVEGRFDRVIVLARFCGHDATVSLARSCRQHGISFHVHPRGATIPALAVTVYGA